MCAYNNITEDGVVKIYPEYLGFCFQCKTLNVIIFSIIGMSVTIGIISALIYFQNKTVMLQTDNDEPLERTDIANHPMILYSPMGKILITYYNFLTIVLTLVEPRKHNFISPLVVVQGPFEFFLKYSNCYIDISRWGKINFDFVGNMIIFMLICLSLLIYLRISPKFKKYWFSHWIGTITVIYNFLYIKMNYFWLMMIVPFRIHTSDPENNVIYVNRYDTTIQYFTSDKVVIIFAFVFFIFWSVIFPLYWVFYVRKRYKNEALFCSKNVKKYSYFFFDYKKSCYYFEAINLNVVKLILCIILLIVDSQNLFYVLLFAMFFWIYGLVIKILEPYYFTNLNDLALIMARVYVISLLGCVVYIYSGLILEEKEIYILNIPFQDIYTIVKISSVAIVSLANLFFIFLIIKILVQNSRTKNMNLPSMIIVEDNYSLVGDFRTKSGLQKLMQLIN